MQLPTVGDPLTKHEVICDGNQAANSLKRCFEIVDMKNSMEEENFPITGIVGVINDVWLIAYGNCIELVRYTVYKEFIHLQKENFPSRIESISYLWHSLGIVHLSTSRQSFGPAWNPSSIATHPPGPDESEIYMLKVIEENNEFKLKVFDLTSSVKGFCQKFIPNESEHPTFHVGNPKIPSKWMQLIHFVHAEQRQRVCFVYRYAAKNGGGTPHSYLYCIADIHEKNDSSIEIVDQCHLFRVNTNTHDILCPPAITSDGRLMALAEEKRIWLYQLDCITKKRQPILAKVKANFLRGKDVFQCIPHKEPIENIKFCALPDHYLLSVSRNELVITKVMDRNMRPGLITLQNIVTPSDWSNLWRPIAMADKYVYVTFGNERVIRIYFLGESIPICKDLRMLAVREVDIIPVPDHFGHISALYAPLPSGYLVVGDSRGNIGILKHPLEQEISEAPLGKGPNNEERKGTMVQKKAGDESAQKIFAIEKNVNADQKIAVRDNSFITRKTCNRKHRISNMNNSLARTNNMCINCCIWLCCNVPCD